jgi:hypothetical protein
MLLIVSILLMAAVTWADTVTLEWDNPTQSVDGATIPAADQAILQTVIEAKASAATTWSEIGVTTNGARTYKWTVGDSYTRGDTIQFRAKSRLTKGGANYDSLYCTAVGWLYPFVKPGIPTNFKIRLTASTSVMGVR